MKSGNLIDERIRAEWIQFILPSFKHTISSDSLTHSVERIPSETQPPLSHSVFAPVD